MENVSADHLKHRCGTNCPLSRHRSTLHLYFLGRISDGFSSVLNILTGTFDRFAGGEDSKGDEEGGEGSDGHDTSPIVICQLNAADWPQVPYRISGTSPRSLDKNFDLPQLHDNPFGLGSLNGDLSSTLFVVRSGPSPENNLVGDKVVLIFYL